MANKFAVSLFRPALKRRGYQADVFLVFHGFLHKDLQGWFDPVLINLTQEEASVNAQYRVSYQGLMTKLLGLNKQGVDVTTRTISIKYDYPHYRSELEGLSSLYLMRSPVGPTETKSFSFLFVKVNLPQWLLKLIKPQLTHGIWRYFLKKFLDQDKEMVESEQLSYSANPQRHYVEINPAIIVLQRIIIRQYEKFMSQSSQSLNGIEHQEAKRRSKAIPAESSQVNRWEE